MTTTDEGQACTLKVDVGALRKLLGGDIGTLALPCCFCAEVRPLAGDLVHAFGIPEQVLAVPLLTDV